jgi:hypothetical protein
MQVVIRACSEPKSAKPTSFTALKEYTTLYRGHNVLNCHDVAKHCRFDDVVLHYLILSPRMLPQLKSRWLLSQVQSVLFVCSGSKKRSLLDVTMIYMWLVECEPDSVCSFIQVKTYEHGIAVSLLGLGKRMNVCSNWLSVVLLKAQLRVWCPQAVRAIFWATECSNYFE